jgi:hypothetical protein
MQHSSYQKAVLPERVDGGFLSRHGTQRGDGRGSANATPPTPSFPPRLRGRHLRYLAPEIAGRETLAAQQFPLSPSSPLSVLIVSREATLLPLLFLGWPSRAQKKHARAKHAKNIAKMVEISEAAAAQQLLDPLSSSGKGGDSGYSNLPVSKPFCPI